MRKHTPLIATLLFGSGCCALVYQIGWLRELRLIFGASTAASAAVLAIFIGGLGMGGWLLGRRADDHPRPLAMYAWLEGIVAVSAALSPLLLWLVRVLYVAAGGTPRLGLLGGTIGRLVLSAVVLAIPTIAMGGTLPAAARAVTAEADVRRRHVAILYASNALGAVIGCLVATFFLLEMFGTRATLWLAAGVNLAIAIAARQTARDEGDGSRIPIQPDSRPPMSSTSFVLIASAISGFVFFLMELVWYRMLGPLVGGSVFSFGLILAVALAGIGIGGFIYARASDKRLPSLSGFALICLCEAVLIAATFALGDRVALLALVLRAKTQAGFLAQVAGWTLVTAVVVLPPSIAAGIKFPTLIALAGRGPAGLGREIGLVYAANTLGAIAGALAGGFGLLPWLSAPGAWRFASIALVALGVAARGTGVAPSGRATPVPQRVAPRGRATPVPRFILHLGLVAASLALLTLTGPTAVWRHSGIGAGRATVSVDPPNRYRDWQHAQRRAIVWDEDGIESSVALAAEPNGYAFIVNGKSDGSARGDAPTQVMLALVGAILNPAARRSLVVGLGTGSSAGWLASVPEMERVDVVELEPLTMDVARACDVVNRDALRNPKVQITIGDAREFLLTSRDRYDLIASEPSNPYRAGVSSLFTREYYAAAGDRLTGQGQFLQWVQLYEIDARTLNTIVATMASVFPHVEAWQTGGDDLVLVGAKAPLTHDAAAIARRIDAEPFKTALRVAWRSDDLTGFLAHFLFNQDFARMTAESPGRTINTDDRNAVEFGFARTVGRRPSTPLGTSGSLLVALRTLSRTVGDARPAGAGRLDIDWEAVDTAWVAFQAAEEHFDRVDPSGSRIERARQAALIHYYRDTDLAAAREAWREQEPASPKPGEGGPKPGEGVSPASGPTELAMVADLQAETGSEEAVAIIDRLRMYQPGEAAAILATLRFRQARFRDAAAALETAFEDFRSNPWALTRFKERALALAAASAARDDLLAARMLEALKPPFALLALQDARLASIATLTRRLNFKGLCRDAVGALEPHVPWTASFLKLRRDCYQTVGDPRLGSASADLEEFVAHETGTGVGE